jgi:predicted nucleic acid-binding protein
MIRLFLDTNVILDLIISDRDGHPSALALESFANTHPCKLSCAWHSLSIIESIGRKRFGSETIHLLLRNLFDTFTYVLSRHHALLKSS